ncbi:plasmid mobilization relaxosome protein MobC [Hydrogenophaga sp.]|uniref:plasmid mobilization protein n=1 Tax=Hydrogenophaga sp. TaxID=1904254 RepID=UPI0035B437C6
MRKQRIYVKTTEEEKAKIIALTKEFQYKTIAEYVRDTALKQNVDYSVLKLKAKTLTELRKIGNNINQISASLNTINKSKDYEIYDLSTLSNILESIKIDLENLRGDK